MNIPKFKFTEYSEYLNSERWKRIKEHFFINEKNKKCAKCFTKKRLDVHHSNYRYLNSNKEISHLFALCRNCHNELHKLCNSKKISVSRGTKIFLNQKSYNKRNNKNIKEIVNYRSRLDLAHEKQNEKLVSKMRELQRMFIDLKNKSL